MLRSTKENKGIAFHIVYTLPTIYHHQQPLDYIPVHSCYMMVVGVEALRNVINLETVKHQAFSVNGKF